MWSPVQDVRKTKAQVSRCVASAEVPWQARAQSPCRWSRPQQTNHTMRRFRPYSSGRYRNPWRNVFGLIGAVFSAMLMLLLAIGTAAGVLAGLVVAAWTAVRKRAE